MFDSHEWEFVTLAKHMGSCPFLNFECMWTFWLLRMPSSVTLWLDSSCLFRMDLLCSLRMVLLHASSNVPLVYPSTGSSINSFKWVFRWSFYVPFKWAFGVFFTWDIMRVEVCTVISKGGQRPVEAGTKVAYALWMLAWSKSCQA